jgi:cytochrome c peroxidase
MRKLALSVAALGAVAALLAALLISAWLNRAPRWTAAELAAVRSLALAALPPLPADPSNAVADDPAAAALGRALFFDPRFSANGQVACATCHAPGLYFTDGKPLGKGVGTINRHTMSLIGSAYSPWYTWDGKADSLWAQALLPLEHPAEHGSDRLSYARLLAEHYGEQYTAIFGPLPDLPDGRRFGGQAAPQGSPQQQAAWASLSAADQEAITRVAVNMGKALAAYQRTLLPHAARFDRYVGALDAAGALRSDAGEDSRLSDEELAGLRLFIGKGQCINCHNGPLLTNFEFHNTGVPGVPGLPLDHGRRAGLAALQASDFTCLGRYSDAAPGECGEIRFLAADSPTADGSFRTPTLRNVGATAPYMHGGQYATLREAIEHYSEGGYALAGHNELSPLNLSEQEVGALVAFLATLTGPAPQP